MSKKQIDVYRTGKYLRLSQGDEDIDGWDKQESNSISNQKLLIEGFIDAHDDLKLVDVFIDDGCIHVIHQIFQCNLQCFILIKFHIRIKVIINGYKPHTKKWKIVSI